jgi:hypothetical protein
VVFADQINARFDRGRNPVGGDGAGRFGPETDADNPAAPGNLQHQVIGDIAPGFAMAVNARVADNHRH